MVKYGDFVKIGASNVELGSGDGTWYTKHSGSIFVTVSQALMNETHFLSTLLTVDRDYLVNYHSKLLQYSAVQNSITNIHTGQDTLKDET